MTDLIRKLNYKNHQSVGIFEAPSEFTPHLEDFAVLGNITKNMGESRLLDFVMIFVQTEEDIQRAAPSVASRLTDDAPFWFAYPKKSSKKYKATINRDYGWKVLGELGFEGVRMVAIDDDWSALRFRKAEKIKTLSRDPKWRLTS